MNEYEIALSKTTTNGTRISCEMCKVTLYADDENEALKIVAEEEPDWTAGKITLIGAA